VALSLGEEAANATAPVAGSNATELVATGGNASASGNTSAAAGGAPQCGVPNAVPKANPPHGTSKVRIVGGIEARKHSFPWIVSFQTRKQHFCGGSLISVGNPTETDIVVTAAHCVEGDSLAMFSDGSVTVIAGAHQFDKPQPGQQEAITEKATYYPAYDSEQVIHDVAIIKLKTPIKFNENVIPICLPAPNQTFPAGTVVTVAGWGLTAEGAKKTSMLLMQVGVPIVDYATCKASQAEGSIVVDSASICAGYKDGGQDACQADSGGPFMIKDGDHYILLGAVSFGNGCARANEYGMYTRISSYVDWIKGEIKKQSKLIPA